MTAFRAPTSVARLVAYSAIGSALMMPGAQAQNTDLNRGAPASVIHFHLSAQSLDRALDAYEHIAKQDVLSDSSQLGGRTSASVDGDYSPHEALRLLLVGTGLQVTFTQAGAAVVVPSASGVASSPDVPPDSAVAPGIIASQIDGVDGHMAYAAQVQAHLAEALCRSPRTRPGAYRMVVQLNIDASGAVTNARVAGPADPQLKAAVARIARVLVFDEAPPAGLRQPITILLRPLGNGVLPDCPSSDGPV